VVSRRVALSPKAVRSLDAIGDWTRERFGPRQADAYVGRIEAAFARLAAGTLKGRSARAKWGEGVREGLLFVPVEKHVVLFLVEPAEVIIVDVLHEAMDLPGRARG
jgi:toxin ParE1/3/4